MTGDWSDLAASFGPAVTGPTPKRSNLSSPLDYSFLSGSSLARGVSRVASTFATTPAGGFMGTGLVEPPMVGSPATLRNLAAALDLSGAAAGGAGSTSDVSWTSMAPPEAPGGPLKTPLKSDAEDLLDHPIPIRPSVPGSGSRALFNPFVSVGAGSKDGHRAIMLYQGPGPMCFGKVGTAGKFCTCIASECPYKGHKSSKVSPLPDLDLLYCVNSRDQALPSPSFSMSELSGSKIWNQYHDQTLPPEGWAAVKQLLEQNAMAMTVEDEVSVGEAEELVKEPSAVAPTTAKKRRFAQNTELQLCSSPGRVSRRTCGYAGGGRRAFFGDDRGISRRIK
eukprot:scaffold6474_cov23-Cyclotella_meneghiniana.AAC.7